MTRAELLALITHLKFLLYDDGHTDLAQEYEETEIRLRTDNWTASQCREYSYFIVPKGREGRIKLLLAPRYEGRGYACLAWLLRSVVP